MKRKLIVWISILVLTLTSVLILPQVVYGQMGRPSRGMMGNPGMGNDAQIIHQLFANHDKIHRTVKQLPNGIQSITESDDPQIAALIQAHVASMYRRVANNQPIPMIHMVPTLPTLLQNRDRYQRQLQNTLNGLTVTETATAPDLIATIQEHAREVSQFVNEGMPTMMRGRAR